MGGSLQLGRGGLTAIDALDRFGRFRTGAHDRFDELPVGVFVTAVDELGDGLTPVGTLVVDAAEIERRERVVQRADQENRREPSGELLEGITQGCGFKRAELFAGAATKVGPPGTQLVGPALGR